MGREAKFEPEGSHQTDPRQDRGSIQTNRVSGVGKSQAGPGGQSRGDTDPEIVGVGTGGTGVSQGGPDERVWGPEYTTGGSEEFASGGPARGENALPPGLVGGNKRVKGSTVDRSGGDASTTGQGAGDQIESEQE